MREGYDILRQTLHGVPFSEVVDGMPRRKRDKQEELIADLRFKLADANEKLNRVGKMIIGGDNGAA